MSSLHILVTRPDPQATLLCEQIREQGNHAIHFPTIAFTSPRDVDQFQQTITKLGEQEWLIFNSPRAVSASISAIRKTWAALPLQVKFAAVGEGTAKALHEAGYPVTVHPQLEWSSEGLLALPEFQTISGKKMAVIRGLGGREYLDKMLAERGAEVLSVIAYERVLPEVINDEILSSLKQHKIDLIICTSFEGVKNLTKLLGDEIWPYLKVCPLMVVSERIKSLAEDLGFQTICVAHNASNTAILEEIRNYDDRTNKR